MSLADSLKPVVFKFCRACKLELSLDKFGSDKSRKDGKQSLCKPCKKLKDKEYYEQNSDKVKSHVNDFRLNNPEIVKERKAQHYNANKDEILVKCKTYRDKNKSKCVAATTAWKKQKRKTDVCFRLRNNFSRALNHKLKSVNSSRIKSLPYSIAELKAHLEAQFEPWMNWDNWGPYNSKTFDSNPKWQIDHIIPASTFVYSSTDDEEFKKCWALSNLRPLSAKENLLDGVNRTRHGGLNGKSS